MPEGLKFDQEKTRLELVPPEIVEAIGQIMTFGANKYGDFNWAYGINYSRVIGALLRHLYSFIRGEINDPESGKPHLWHAACNLAFLITFESRPEQYSQFNNLFYHKKKE